jgi:cytochrome P450
MPPACAATDDGLVTSSHFLLSGASERHAAYRRLRDAGPVQRITLPSGATGWLVMGYQQARQALAEPRLSGRTGAVGDRRNLSLDVRLGMNTHMLNLDPPDHTRLRRLVSQAFTSRRIAGLRPLIERLTGELLDAMDGDTVDLVETLALPLPIRVLSEMLGIPRQDADTFHGWTKTLTSSDCPLDELDATAADMLGYVRALLRAKRQEPGTDLLSALVAVRDGDDRLAEHELTSMVFLLMIAGHETTVNLIANGVLALISNPVQLAQLRSDPARISAAVEELLRYESPVHAALRFSREEIKLGDTTIPAGSVVIVSLMAANRDPARFVAANQLDLWREGNRQLAFGYGIHHCLGAPLARLEGGIAISSLLARFPRLRAAVPADSLSWRVSMVMHGLDTLPVRLR